jgi:Rad3-related DNA helicase
MLEEVYAIASAHNLEKRVRLICQNQNMREEEREEFLQQFDGEGITGFCIMGGIFSEGIDLTGEKLIGAIIVGTGLPMVCNERDILKNYFELHEGRGFEYAYLYPGMNKVLQAAGRVIRTTEDKGVILLLDERFLRPENQQMFPREWNDYQVISCNQAGKAVADFWEHHS